MKIKILICVTIFLLLLLSACSAKKDTIITDNRESSFTYDINDVVSFTVDDSGKLYCSTRNRTSLYCYDNMGKIIKEYNIGEGLNTNLCIEDNYIYYISYLDDGGVALRRLNIESGEVNELFKDKDITSVIKMEVINDNIYYIKWSDAHDPEQEQVRYDEHDDYYYMGEIAAVYHIDKGTSKPIDINNVILFTKTDDDNLLFYAYDSIGGFYFTTFDTQQQQFRDKTYNNTMGYFFSFAYDSGNDKIIYSKHHDRNLYVTDRKDTGVKAELMRGIIATSGNDTLFRDNHTYILDNVTGKIKRIDNSKAIKNNKPIKIIQPFFYIDAAPGCGYSIDSETISEEEFALTLLSGDSSYDLCLMSSNDDFSRSIRDKEPFYPLNDVPGVKAYLDACFPYIKEAATSESGDIWMIPIAVNANCIVYHEDNCKAEGIHFSEVKSMDDLLHIAKDLGNNPNALNRYGLPVLSINEYAISQYINFYGVQDNKANFDTKLFRALCMQMSEIMSPTSSDIDGSRIYMPVDVGFENYYGNYLFELLMYKFRAYEDTAYHLLKAMPLPPIEPGVYTPNSVKCTYICVNPNSDNLENTLAYISDLCIAMSTQVDTFMLQDTQYYSYNDSKLTRDLYEIYSNGIVSFPFSYEIFWDDYLRYHRGEMELNALIMEIERKVNAYLQE